MSDHLIECNTSQHTLFIFIHNSWLGKWQIVVWPNLLFQVQEWEHVFLPIKIKKLTISCLIWGNLRKIKLLEINSLTFSLLIIGKNYDRNWTHKVFWIKYSRVIIFNYSVFWKLQLDLPNLVETFIEWLILIVWQSSQSRS